MPSIGRQLYAFEGYTVDLIRGCLRNAAGEIQLRPKSFELLRYLVQNAGRLIPKDELVTAVWPNVIVGDDSLAQCMSELRNALSDFDRRIIKTVPRRGYLFAVPVSIIPSETIKPVDPGRSPPEDATSLPESTVTRDTEPITSTSNLASILAANATGYDIYVSSRVQEDAADKPNLLFEDVGDQLVGNIFPPVGTHRVTQDEAIIVTGTSLPLPDKPSIAVLAFTNMSGDPEQEYFADGMVEEIITALSRIHWLFVIARTSSFAFKTRAVDVKQIGQELGVRYVLEGSVRKVGNRVRITAQLIDALTGVHLWADHLDGTLDNVFELQDRVAITVAGVIEPTLQIAEIRRSTERPTDDLTAYDLYLRALALAFSWEKDATVRALELLEKAIERDPRYGSALAEAGARHFELHVNGWTDDPEASCRKGIDFARRALQVAADDPDVLGTTGFTLGYFGEEIHVAIGLVDRGLKLNQSSARSWQRAGWLRLWAGQPDLAIEHFETSLRLNPRKQRANPFMGIGVAHFFARRFEAAKATLLQSLQEKPNWVPTYRFLAACYAHMGHVQEAQNVVKRLREITFDVVPSATHWRNPEDRAFYLSGLRLAAGQLG